jgi:acyl-CoA thioesterase II
VSDLKLLLDALTLEPTGERTFRAGNIEFAGGATVFGGQLMAQAIVAGATIDPEKQVRSLHTVFARGASVEAPLDIELDVIAQGRSFASASVAIRQGGRDCVRSIVLLSSPEPDRIRHQPEPPAVEPPADAVVGSHGPSFWELRMEPGVDLADPAVVGPAELLAWARFPDAPTDGTIGRALLAFASDGFLIGTAMRPHEGVGQSMAHVTLSTTVIDHTLSFHEDVDAGQWMALQMASPYAGHGCSYGRGEVFGSGGLHVASFVQDNMIRDFPPGREPAAGTRSAH